MAKVKIQMPDDFLKQISKLGARTDEIVEVVLHEGAEVIEKKVKSNLGGSIGRGLAYEGRSTGTLISALGVSGMKVNKDGNHDVKIGFAENRSDGVSNAKLANILEYGKSGQAAKPFFAPAISASKAPCMEAMKAAFEREVAKK